MLGAGLDARAYHMEALRDCHVIEIDQSLELFEHKKVVMQDLEAPLMARKHDCIKNEALLKTIDGLSAPGSEFWADISGRVLVEEAELVNRTMKHGEDEPLRSMSIQIPWQLELQGTLQDRATHFGREYTPILSATTKSPVPFHFVVGTKPSKSSQ
ncbi:hypothetical protein BBJ28_00004461 [Nothophytophthora sp. Chile5]|nr:hypothetical protein BBJ28_00004461 [Nothophytophthora sp. Chile5]